MRLRSLASLLAIPVLAVGTVAWQPASAEPASYKATYGAALVGTEEVPPVTTDTTGNAVLRLANDEQSMSYSVAVANGKAITMAHLHCGQRGQNGPVAVSLYMDMAGRDVNGELASGTITAANFTPAAASCNPNIRSVSHLAQAIREGGIYVNVHSVQFPNGVVRGQLAEQAQPTATPSTTPVPNGQQRPFLVATANPDGIANDSLVSITDNLATATPGFKAFGSATSVQSNEVATGGQAFVTFDAPNATGGFMVLDNASKGASAQVLRTVVGPATGLVAPKGLELVPSRQAVVIADFGTKHIKAFSDTANGNVAPLFAVTNLGGVEGRSVWDVDYDPRTDTLYVAATDGTVLVYDDFFRDKGVTGPTKQIVPAAANEAKLSVNLHGIVYNAERGSLILSDVGSATSATDGQIFTISNVARASGNTPVDLKLAGPATRLGNPVDLAFDGQQLYVAEKSNDAVLQFRDIFARRGNLDLAPDLSVKVTKPESVSLVK